MRKALLLLTPLLVAGCVQESASYYADGNDHTLTVRAEQEYFWDKSVNIKLMAARMPDCQRQFTLTKAPLEDLTVELFAAPDNVFTFRVGAQAWQVETNTCTQLGEPAPTAYGEPVGVFRLGDDKKMVLEKVAAPAPAAATPG
jgi:hypothetical protein